MLSLFHDDPFDDWGQQYDDFYRADANESDYPFDDDDNYEYPEYQDEDDPFWLIDPDMEVLEKHGLTEYDFQGVPAFEPVRKAVEVSGAIQSEGWYSLREKRRNSKKCTSSFYGKWGKKKRRKKGTRSLRTMHPAFMPERNDTAQDAGLY